MWSASRVSVCRRELNSQETASRPFASSFISGRSTPRHTPRISREVPTPNRESFYVKAVCSYTRQNYSAKTTQFHHRWRHAGTLEKSGRGAVAAGKRLGCQLPRGRRLQDAEASGFICAECASQLRSSAKVTGPWPTHLSSLARTPMPNPSLNRSANGRPPSPVWRYAVHFRQPGLGVLPLSPG